MSGAHQGVFLPPRERDLFKISLEPVVLGDINPNHTSLIFPGNEPEKPDLDSLLLDIPEEIRARVNLAE